MNQSSSHTVHGILASVVLLMGAGCGDSNLPGEPDPRPPIIRIYGETGLDNQEELLFRFAIPHEEGDEFSFYTHSTRGLLPFLDDAESMEVVSYDIRSDSVFFRIEDGGKLLIDAQARWSRDLLTGSMVLGEGDDAESRSWWGWGCAALSAPDQEPTELVVDRIAEPLEFSLPDYPDSLIAREIGGTISMIVIVGRCGSVLRMEPRRGFFEPFDQSVRDAISSWVFHPARISRRYFTNRQFLAIDYNIVAPGVGEVVIRNGGV